MKPLFAFLFLVLCSSLLVGLSTGAAKAQAQPGSHASRVPAPVVVGPFQALGNVIRNPDADPPRRYRAPTDRIPPPTIIPPNTLQNGAAGTR